MSIFTGISASGWGSGWTQASGGSADDRGSADPSRGLSCRAVALSSLRALLRLCRSDSSLDAGVSGTNPGKGLAGAIGGAVSMGRVSAGAASGCGTAGG